MNDKDHLVGQLTNAHRDYDHGVMWFDDEMMTNQGHNSKGEYTAGTRSRRRGLPRRT